MDDFNPMLLLAKAIVGTAVDIDLHYMELIGDAYIMGFTHVRFDPKAPFLTASGHPDVPELSYDFVSHTVAANAEADIENLEVEDLPAYITEHGAR